MEENLPPSKVAAPSRDSTRVHSHLPRLTPKSYLGHAAVHWTMTINHRTTGWLDSSHHALLRELLLHTCHRYALACPAYCLMPDHAHFFWLGLDPISDQRLAAAWFRRHWNALLAPAHTLQRQAHDHVLRDTEREQNAFTTIATYILQNPQRTHLVSDWKTWPHLGAIFPGVHPLDPRTPDHWDRFWREHTRRVQPPPT
jgi:putative transposase